MRPNNQNKRSRGRSNNGRKHSNPLSRNYESNGPDVKVRGNAAHVAEKYVQLARDAQASGDQVMAENYFQHAEHYFRIISAAQAQMAQRSEQQPFMGNDSQGDIDDDSNDDDDGVNADGNEGQGFHAGQDADDQPQPRRDNRRDGRDNRRDQRRPRREEPTEAEAGSEQPAEVEAVQPAEAADGDEDKPAKKPRRPRRKPRSEEQSEEGEGSSELPAFLTAGITSAAE